MPREPAEIVAPATGDPTAIAPPGPAGGSRPLLRHRDFLLLWSGQSVSEIGSAVSQLALPLLAVTVLKASAFAVSLLSFLSGLAFLLIALPAGVIVDRRRKRRMMLGCDVARMLIIASIPVAAIFWHVTLWQLYIVAGSVGVLTVFFDVAYQSYLPFLVDADQLADGNGKLGTTRSFADLAGPSLGGLLVSLIGAARTLTADSASYLVSALSLAFIRTPEPHPGATGLGHRERVPFRAAMREGLHFVVTHPILRKVVACTATSNFFGSAGGAVQVVFLVRTLHATPTQIGLLYALGATGGLLGGLLCGRLMRLVGSARIIWAAQVVSAPLYFLVPLAQPGWGLLMFAAGNIAFTVMVVVYNVAQLTYRQSICPPALLGRMNASVRWIVWGTIPLGALFGGALATWIGLRPTIFVEAVGCMLAPLFVIFSPLRRMRDFPLKPSEPSAS